MITKPIKHSPNPNHKIKIAATIFDQYYKEKKGVPYLFTPKDFANLKLLIRKIETVKDVDNTLDFLFVFLRKITSNWHLENLSIPLINSHFNKLLADAVNPEQTKNEYRYQVRANSVTLTMEDLEEIDQIKMAYEKQKAQPVKPTKYISPIRQKLQSIKPNPNANSL
jgi:hypothetical protein